MSATEVQAFLNSKVPECDTQGDKAYGSTTRRAYAATKGVSPPFTCLKDYRQNTPSRAGESGLCGALSARTSRSAALIIDDVSRACGVSQKALIVLLQKEQSLITDDWPWPIQYRSATGYGCLIPRHVILNTMVSLIRSITLHVNSSVTVLTQHTLTSGLEEITSFSIIPSLLVADQMSMSKTRLRLDSTITPLTSQTVLL